MRVTGVDLQPLVRSAFSSFWDLDVWAHGFRLHLCESRRSVRELLAFGFPREAICFRSWLQPALALPLRATIRSRSCDQPALATSLRETCRIEDNASALARDFPFVRASIGIRISKSGSNDQAQARRTCDSRLQERRQPALPGAICWALSSKTDIVAQQHERARLLIRADRVLR